MSTVGYCRITVFKSQCPHGCGQWVSHQNVSVHIHVVGFEHSSVGLEILEEVNDADVMLVPCGGGALLAGVAAAVKLTGLTHCRVYGVEPQQGKYTCLI